MSALRAAFRVAWRLVLALLVLAVLALAGFRLAAAIREGAVERPAHLTMLDTPYGEVAADIRGPADGPRILLVHGSAAWSGFWRDVTAQLAAQGWRVIALDVPPFGFSERDPQGRYGRIAQAERLAAVLRAAGGHATVVGHSFGAGAATELALTDPTLVERLVLVDAALGELDPPAGEGFVSDALGFAPLGEGVTAATVTNPLMTGRLLRGFIHRKEAAARWIDTVEMPMRRAGSTTAYARWLPALVARNEGALSRQEANLRRIAVPVHLIWGREDTVTPPRQAEQLAAIFGDAPIEWLPDTGHIPHIESPAAFMAALERAAGSPGAADGQPDR